MVRGSSAICARRSSSRFSRRVRVEPGWGFTLRASSAMRTVVRSIFCPKDPERTFASRCGEPPQAPANRNDNAIFERLRPMSRKTRGQPKVLIIDDEPDLLELLELTLSRMGIDATRSETVGEALRRLDSEPFDLCLTDMRLPDGDGLRVVEHINNRGLDVPVAVITAYGSAENAVAALKAGAFDYLAKPVALEQLRALVKQALKVPEMPQASS